MKIKRPEKPHDDNPESGRRSVLQQKNQMPEHVATQLVTCRWCLSPLPISARVCPTCKSHQKWVWNYFSQVLLVWKEKTILLFIGDSPSIETK